jgi:hypothetical protein
MRDRVDGVMKPHPHTSTLDKQRDGLFLELIEQCEDMMHRWLITQHEKHRSEQRTAVLVVRFPSSNSADEPEADFFYDGDIDWDGEKGDQTGAHAAGNHTKAAVRQAKDFFDRGGVLHLSDAEVQLAEHLRSKGAWIDEMVGRIEATMEELRLRESRSMQKETMITKKFKELRSDTGGVQRLFSPRASMIHHARRKSICIF